MRGGHRDHGRSAPAQAACPGYAGRPIVERVSPTARLGLGGGPGPVRTFGPSGGSEVASHGKSRVMTTSYLSTLSGEAFEVENSCAAVKRLQRRGELRAFLAHNHHLTCMQCLCDRRAQDLIDLRQLTFQVLPIAAK